MSLYFLVFHQNITRRKRNVWNVHLLATYLLLIMKELKEILVKYIPQNALNQVVDLISANNVQLNITRNRKTKLGDYRPPQNGYLFHRISINYNLNEFEFLVTLIHEFAHLFVWNKHKNKVEPHGKEFKTTYYSLLNQFVEQNVFPEEIKTAIQKLEISPENAKLEIGRAVQKYTLSNQTQFLWKKSL